MVSSPRIHLTLLALLLGHVLAFASRQDDSTSTGADAQLTAAQRALAILGRANLHARNNPGETLVQVRMAVGFAERSNNPVILLRALRFQRDLQKTAGAYDESLQSAIRVLDLSEKRDDHRATANDLRCLAEAYEHLGAFDKAVDVAKQALILLRATGDSAAISKGLMDLMNTLIKAGRFTDVLHQSEEALNYFNGRRDTIGLAGVWMIEGEALVAQGRFANSIPMLIKARRILRSHEVSADLMRLDLALAEANIGMGYWNEAKRDLDSVQYWCSMSNDLFVGPRFYQLRRDLSESLGKIPEALADLKRYHLLKDSLYDLRMAERMAGLQAFYQSDKRDKELGELNEKNKANEQMIDAAQARNRWMLVLFVVMLGLLALLFVIFRQMRRAMRRLNLKNMVVKKQSEEIRMKNMELERQNLRLADSMTHEHEKDILLKEIHHRVKNNLQIVITLLKLQGTFPEKRELNEVLNDCQGRVRSMALVHEHIYKCGDLNRVNVRSHVLALAASVLRHYGLESKVGLDLNVSYDKAPLENLIPLSLMLNELVTNSAKHAFEGRENGRITIALRRLGEHQCELVYTDDGQGMASEAFYSSSSFGLELVRTLATQLNGSIRLLKGEGTTFQMSFCPEDGLLQKAS